MTSRDGKSQRREERRSKKRKSQKKEDPGAQKGRKVAKHYVFPMICGSRGSKSRLKRRVQSQLARWEMKNCTPLWREAHFQIKMYKSAFRSCDVEKDRKSARRSRSTFRSQKCKKLTVSEHFWKLRCRKSARRCGAKHISKSKVQETEGYGALLDVQMWFCVAVARDCAPFQTWAKRAGFVAFRKTIGRRGTFEEDLQRYIFRGRRSTRDMFIRDVRRSGHWFPERGCILEHQIFSFGKMILRDRCGTSYDLASLFRGRRCTLDRWHGKIGKRIGTRPWALHSTFNFWRNSRRIVSFLMLSPSKNEKVSQNCFVFALVDFENWGSLADLFRFWRCQVQKLRKSRRIAWFSSLQIAAR